VDMQDNKEKSLIAYKKKQKTVVALISKIRNKLDVHAESVISWGSVGDLYYIEGLLNEIDIFLSNAQ